MDIVVRLPRLSAEQALAVLDVLDALHDAVWQAYERDIVPIIVAELAQRDAPAPDGGVDEDTPY